MRLVEGLSRLARVPRGGVVTVGVFDGLHRGHQAIIERVVRRARASRGTSVVVTFRPHPVRVLRPEKPVLVLTPEPMKWRLLNSLGVDLCVVLRFTRRLAARTPAEFVDRVLVGRLAVRRLVVGANFFFGSGRGGGPALLRRLGVRSGFEVEVVPALRTKGRVVSSTAIRGAIVRGEFAEAAALLGRPYGIEATVVEGRGLGRRLGYPTANLRMTEESLPPDGVYAGWARSRKRYPGLLYVGRRPSVSDRGPRRAEVHLLGRRGSLVGHTVTFAFVRKIRGDRRFASLSALRSQIQRDETRARACLGELSDGIARC